MINLSQLTENQQGKFWDTFYDQCWEFETWDKDASCPWGAPWTWEKDVVIQAESIEEAAKKFYAIKRDEIYQIFVEMENHPIDMY